MLRHVALVRTYILEECQFLQEPRGVTSQKMAFFITDYVTDLMEETCDNQRYVPQHLKPASDSMKAQGEHRKKTRFGCTQ
jgi:hypothetical protein